VTVALSGTLGRVTRRLPGLQSTRLPSSLRPSGSFRSASWPGRRRVWSMTASAQPHVPRSSRRHRTPRRRASSYRRCARSFAGRGRRDQCLPGQVAPAAVKDWLAELEREHGPVPPEAVEWAFKSSSGGRQAVGDPLAPPAARMPRSSPGSQAPGHPIVFWPSMLSRRMSTCRLVELA
jgi:hypothetical protein